MTTITTNQRLISEKQRRNSEANLRPWRPGESGNRKGRPKKSDCLTDLLRTEIEKIDPDDKEGRTWGELVAVATIKLALQGNATALREVWERLDGKVAQAVTGEDGGTLSGAITVQFVESPGQTDSTLGVRSRGSSHAQ
jgi:hypothetical protein